MQDKIITPQLVSQRVIPPKSELYFNHILNTNVRAWEALYTLPLRLTIDTKLRDFQWKILHNILPTNVKLHKMLIIASPACTFCGVENETLLHLFCDCTEVKSFWETVHQKWRKHLKLCFPFTAEAILLGDTMTTMLTNFLLLAAKRYIYICRCDRKNLSFNAYRAFVSNLQKIEAFIAKRRNTIRKHEKKWKEIINTLDPNIDG